MIGECRTCCHYHKDKRPRCSVYHDSLCEKVYGFCKGKHYRNTKHFISIKNEMRKLREMMETDDTIRKRPVETNTHYTLWVHPNGHYWKIKDKTNNKEYAKNDAVALVNELATKTAILDRLENKPVLTVKGENVWCLGYKPDITEHNVLSLMMEQADRIKELENLLDDVETELEELEMENRRLINQKRDENDELDNDDSGGISFDTGLLVPDGGVPPTGTGVRVQMLERKADNMKMVDDTPLNDGGKTMDILKKMVRYCRMCEDLNIDYEPYVDKDYLLTVQKQLECVLDNRDKIRRRL